MKLAILETDTPVPAAFAQYGSYGDIFRALLERGGVPSDVEISYYDVVKDQDYPPISDIDAILITGSKFDAHSDIDWILKLTEYTKKALDNNKKIIGICFGHQILARALGVNGERNPKGWEVASTEIELTETGKKVFSKLSKEHDGTLRIMQMHQDIVPRVPEGAELLASSPVCKVQGLYKKDAFISLQGHPEFVPGIVDKILDVREQAGIFTEEKMKEYRELAAKRQDGDAIAKVLVEFLYV
ncbi:putative glutamine amidotransferase-like protein C13C5.04 [Yarrowia sp. C11]|nr:putative glutamine amidotransferase-like protein C13C5.04 [Yarrowia sp. C11]KAG5370540.1 putative glutamine amidotransferase-like protein C13C5.04 [Yarrowia sp. E02]